MTIENIFKNIKITDCWEWQGWINRAGYGELTIAGIKWRAHRWFYKFYKGEIPEGLDLDHLCANKRCVNPEHLEAVPHQVNIKRAYDRMPRKTHCHNGHALEGKNLYVYTEKSGKTWRGCKTCRKANR